MGRIEDDFQMNTVAAFLSGLLGAMGFGGGSILIIYLTSIVGTEQVAAQGINLLFFIPCALASVIYNLKKSLVRYKSAMYIIAGAIPGLAAGAFLISRIETDMLGKLFGGFLVISGAVLLLSRKK